MKLRRALASVAVTAAVAPAALIGATSAFADGDGTPSPTASASASATATPSASATATTTATPSASASATASASAPATPTTSAPATPTTSPSAPSDTVCDESGEQPKFDEKLTTKVSGLPGKIAAGSGWHPFSMSVSNASGNDYKRVDFALFAATESAKNWNEDTSHLTLQFQNPDTGKWVDISLDENDPDAGYLGWTSVKAHESFTLKLRLDIDAKADAGKGYVLGFGVYADSKGECVLSGGDDNSYLFEVLAAGSTGGGSAQPDSGGQKPLPAKPAGDLQLTGGDLAETGSSSMLPTIAIVGGVAVALGAGGMFVLRRRKAGTPGGLAS